jgi:hypothetical protein
MGRACSTDGREQECMLGPGRKTRRKVLGSIELVKIYIGTRHYDSLLRISRRLNIAQRETHNIQRVSERKIPAPQLWLVV